jgi:hypothetical protein
MKLIPLNPHSSAPVNLHCVVTNVVMDYNEAIKKGWKYDTEGKAFDIYHSYYSPEGIEIMELMEKGEHEEAERKKSEFFFQNNPSYMREKIRRQAREIMEKDVDIPLDF